MLGSDLTWQEIFAQTDRDINLQRVMNVLLYGIQTVEMDWIPERAIGPTEDVLYDCEAEYNDSELARILSKLLAEVQSMLTSEKRLILMSERVTDLRKLVKVYYEERGWNANGVPIVETLQGIGLWDFLTDEARLQITKLNS